MEDVLLALLVTPFAKIAEAPLFFAEVAVGGVLTGVMYSLVALGFVLIFKASGIFNFAQGVMVLFAALTLVGLIERGAPVWLALILTAAVMTALAFAIERVVLRPLVNQPGIILFMATIGLTFFLEGLGETLWGSNVKKLSVGIPDEPVEILGILVGTFDLWAAGIGALIYLIRTWGGYPDGLYGEEIPLESRIIAVCDAYSAMPSDRPYRTRLSREEARRRLREGAGTQFDPRVVETFLKLLP